MGLCTVGTCVGAQGTYLHVNRMKISAAEMPPPPPPPPPPPLRNQKLGRGDNARERETPDHQPHRQPDCRSHHQPHNLADHEPDCETRNRVLYKEEF